MKYLGLFFFFFLEAFVCKIDIVQLCWNFSRKVPLATAPLYVPISDGKDVKKQQQKGNDLLIG